MKYESARNLHNEDEVTVKETGTVVTVLKSYVNPINSRYVVVECDDGNLYFHDEIE